MADLTLAVTLTRHALQLCRQGVASLQSLQRYHSMDASAAASLLTLTLTQLPAAAEGGVGGGMGGGLGGLGGAADADAVVSSLTLVELPGTEKLGQTAEARTLLSNRAQTHALTLTLPPSPHAHAHPPTLTQTRSLTRAQSLAQALTLHLPRTARGCT